MQAPLRVLLALRPTVAPALLVAVASSTVVFGSTPFILPAVADEHGVSVGTAGLISASQLAGFVVASWFGGRFLHPVRSVFVIGTLLGVFANLTSAVAPNFEVLTATRFVSGISLGLAAWFAWQDAFGDEGKIGDVAVVGPLVGMVVAPVVSGLIETIGVNGVYLVLAGVAATPLLFVAGVSAHDELRPHRTRHAATRAARAILVALGIVTLGGSSVFVYGAAIGTEANGMSALTVALIYSANAVASIPAAKWYGPRGPAGVWFVGAAICAFSVAGVRSSVVFSVALIGWGFVFFMGVPAAFGLLAARSNFPEERAGDAQAVMALGRVFGPLLGGVFIGAGAFGWLAVVSASILALAGATLLFVDRRRFVVERGRVHLRR